MSRETLKWARLGGVQDTAVSTRKEAYLHLEQGKLG